MKAPELFRLFTPDPLRIGLLIAALFVGIPTLVVIAFMPQVTAWWIVSIHGPDLQKEFGFRANYKDVQTPTGPVKMFVIEHVEDGRALSEAGFESGDMPVGYKHGVAVQFYQELIWVREGSPQRFQVLRSSDYARGLLNARELVVTMGVDRGGSPSNTRVNPTVRSVTGLACARPAPSRSAGYAQR